MTDPSEGFHLPGIILLSSLEEFPVRENLALAEMIAACDPALSPEDVHHKWTVQESGQCYGDVAFGRHRCKLIGLPSPIPASTVDRTINVSYWQPAAKVAMRQHKSHLICAYQGDHPDPLEQMTALYQVAHSLQHPQLRAVVNEMAWTAHPPGDFLSPEKIHTYRDEIPFILWFGYVKFFVDKQNFWIATKGHAIFDVPDLAYFVSSEEQTSDIMNLFINIFYYLRDNNAIITPGDTMEISGAEDYLRFSKVTEFEDYLMGPSGTLVIERISPKDINP
jgi:hypothetical protein